MDSFRSRFAQLAALGPVRGGSDRARSIASALRDGDVACVAAAWLVAVAVIAAVSRIEVPLAWAMIASLATLSAVRLLLTPASPTGIAALAALAVSALMLPIAVESFAWVATLAFAIWASAPRSSDRAAIGEAGPIAEQSRSVAHVGSLERTATDAGTLLVGIVQPSAADRRETIHYPFVPPLPGPPDVRIECSNTDTHASVDEVTAFGARLTVCGRGPIRIAAFCPADMTDDESGDPGLRAFSEAG